MTKPYFVISSISAISSALSVQPIALTFCSTCSTRVAPAITLETCGRAASQEKASSSMEWPRALRERLQLLDDVLVARRDVAVAQARHLAEARVVGRRLAALVLAGQQSARQREERQQAELVFLRRRQQILLDVAHDEAVFVLAGDETADVHRARDIFGFGDAPGRKVGIADVAHLALAHEIVERAQRLLDRRQRIVIVLLVEIDVVGLQPLQARLDRLDMM